MIGAYRVLRRLNDLLYRIVVAVCGVLVATIVATVFAQVLARYVFLSPLIWSEEASVFAMIWAVLLGASLGVRDSSHLVADFLPRSLPAVVEVVLTAVLYAAIFTVAFVFIRYGYEFSMLGLRRFSFSTGWPMIYVYMSMPIAGVLSVLFAIENILGLLSGAGDRR